MTTPATPTTSTYRSIRIDAESFNILRGLGDGNLSKGIRTAAQLTLVQSKSHLPHTTLLLAQRLAQAQGLTTNQLIDKALNIYDETLTREGKVPEYYQGTFNTKSRNKNRDNRIMQMVMERVPRAVIAARFNISLPRVHQIIADHKANNPDFEASPATPTARPKSKNQQMLEQGMAELAALNPATPTPEAKEENPLPFAEEDLDELGWE